MVDGSPTIKARWFRNEPDASKFCKLKREEFQQLGDSSAFLTPELRLEAVSCAKLLAPTGKTITEAVRYFLKETELLEKSSATVRSVADSLIKHRKDKGRGFAYLLQLEGFLKVFCADFGEAKIATVKTHQLESWLNTQNADKTRSPVTFNNQRNHLVGLFNYAQKKEFIEQNPAESIETRETQRRGKKRQNRLVTPEDLVVILSQAPDRLKTPLVLMAFCGLRIAEVARLKWEDVLIEDKVVLISEEIAKTKSNRVVPFSSSVGFYLDKAKGAPEDYVFQPERLEEITDDPEQNDFLRGRALKQSLRKYKLKLGKNVKWEANSLRVSAISYTVQLLQNTYQTAERMGNSVAIIKRNYQNLTTQRQAQKWFSLDPLSEKTPDSHFHLDTKKKKLWREILELSDENDRLRRRGEMIIKWAEKRMKEMD